MDEVHRALDLGVDALTELGLAYAVVGGLAVAAWGSPRATRDVDLYADLHGREAELERALRRRGFVVPAMRGELERFGIFRSRLGKEGVFLDIFDAANPLGEAVLGRRRPVRIGGRDVWFVSPEDLAVLKVVSDRARDADDLAMLLAPENRVDLAYVAEWARRLDRSIGGDDVSERLRQALAKSAATKLANAPLRGAKRAPKKARPPRRRQ
jgi:Nucleotidyl transferase of unknown function (DUF2204)